MESPLYSSELFSSSYTTAICSDKPGPKWSEKKFSSGIHASAANERYLAMKKEREDLRPFQGAPFDPQNTFATTGYGVRGSGTWKFRSPALIESSPPPDPPPAGNGPINTRPTVVGPLSLATLKASR